MELSYNSLDELQTWWHRAKRRFWEANILDVQVFNPIVQFFTSYSVHMTTDT